MDEQTRLQSKVRGALAYPLVMAVVVILILFLMMSVVVPKVTSIFENFNQTLPWYTRLLIFVSDIFSNYWWLLGALLIGVIHSAESRGYEDQAYAVTAFNISDELDE